MKMIKDIIVKEIFKAVAKEFISEVIKLIPEEYKLLFFSAGSAFPVLILYVTKCNEKNLNNIHKMVLLLSV